jgi:hypothetical protein
MTDPNEDLIGYVFVASVKDDLPLTEWTVTGTPEWSEGNYVQIENEGKKLRTVRPAGLVRARKLAEEDDGA